MDKLLTDLSTSPVRAIGYADNIHTRAVTRVAPTRVELELDLSQLGRVEFFSTRVFELDFYVLRGQILGQPWLK